MQYFWSRNRVFYFKGWLCNNHSSFCC